MAKASLIDRWIDQLSVDSKSMEENVRLLAGNLQEIFKSEIILSKKLAAEAAHLPYAHLAEEAMALVKEKEACADKIEKIVDDLGGAVDKASVTEFEADANGQFTEVLKLETELGDRMVEELNLAEDCGLDDVASILITLKETHDRHQEAIERLIMKTNAAL